MFPEVDVYIDDEYKDMYVSIFYFCVCLIVSLLYLVLFSSLGDRLIEYLPFGKDIENFPKLLILFIIFSSIIIYSFITSLGFIYRTRFPYLKAFFINALL